MSGHHFRDYHLLLDEHAEQLFAMTELLASEFERLAGHNAVNRSDYAYQACAR